MSGTSWTCRIIRSWSYNSFERFESIRNYSKARILGAVWVKAKRCRMASCHEWTVALTAVKERFFSIVSWPVMKSGYTTITQSVEDCWVSLAMHQHRWQNHYSWLEASVLHLVSSAGCSLLWAAQTCWKHHGSLLSSTIDAPYSPDISSFDYSLFWLMIQGLAESTIILLKIPKLGWLVVSLKRRVVLLMWNSKASRKMGKSCG